MDYVCRICNQDIESPEMSYCMHCNAPFHFDCIKKHLFDKKACPHCDRRTTLLHIRKGIPQSTEEQTPLEEYKVPKKYVLGADKEKTLEREAPPSRPHRERPKKQEKRHKAEKQSGGGRILLLSNFIVVMLLVASVYYVSMNYVGYAPIIHSSNYSESVIPGQTVDFDLDFINSGNIVCKYRAYIDKTELPEGWQATLVFENEVYDTKILTEAKPGKTINLKLRVSTSHDMGANTGGVVYFNVESLDKKYSDSTEFVVTSQAIYNYELNADNTEKYVSAGEMETFSATITNKGNTSDTYFITLEKSGLPQNWSASLQFDKITLKTNESYQIPLSITSPSTASGNDKGEAVLKVYSQKMPDDIKTIKFSLVVNPTYGFDIAVGENSKMVVGGTITFFVFKIQNMGNSEETFDINAVKSIPAGWEATLTKEEATISPGDETTISISIKTPTDALPNQKGTVFVTVTSQGNEESKTANFEVSISAQQNKFVMVELFTSVNCTFCPFAENAADDLLQNYPDNFIILEYHLNDSMQTTFSRNRGAFYGIEGTPICMFDGFRKVKGGSSNTYGEYVQKTEDLRNEELLIRIDLDVTESAFSPGMETITAMLKPQGLSTQNNLEVFFITYRNGISPQNKPSKVYNYVVQESYSKIISPLDTITSVSTTLNIPEDGGVVVYVQDTVTGKIYQATVWIG
ncbi:MAG: hypothetical protein ACXQTP_03585 [Candidatus Methanofastidiosia archaeon]